MNTLFRSTILGIVSCLMLSAYAQDNDYELTGTLKKVKATNTVAIGYRESSVPFSYLSSRNEPIGYSIELCHSLVDAMSEALGQELTIKWVPVSADNRIDAVVTGKVDLECGSTTNNAERQKLVAFSPIIFVSGTKLLVKKNSGIKSFHDLNGKTVVVTSGTTNEPVIHAIKQKFGVNYTITTSGDHAASFAMLVAGKADAFATDDVLLSGIIANNHAQNDYVVTGEYLSYDPYGIMYRKGDLAMKKLIENSFYKMAQEGDLEHIYNKWFLTRLPAGTRINLPMSPQLESIFQSMKTQAF